MGCAGRGREYCQKYLIGPGEAKLQALAETGQKAYPSRLALGVRGDYVPPSRTLEEGWRHWET